MQDFSNIKKRIKETEEWLQKEFSQIRTGQATPSILDGVLVEVYGSKMPINQVATVVSEDPRTLRISPWDQSNLKAVEKSLITSNLGLSVSVDDKGIRVSFPPLTTETRMQFVKLSKQRLEDAKVAIRQERNKFNDELQSSKKDGIISEDEMMRSKTELEKVIKEAGETLDGLFSKKEAQILG